MCSSDLVRNPVGFVKHTSSLRRRLFPESLFFGSSEKSSLQSSNMCSSDFIRVIIFLDFVDYRAKFLNDCMALAKTGGIWGVVLQELLDCRKTLNIRFQSN